MQCHTFSSQGPYCPPPILLPPPLFPRGSPYWNAFWLSISQVPGILLSGVLVDWVGRRPPIFVGFVIATIANVVTALLDGWPQRVAAFLGQLGVTMSFDTIFVPLGEVFPTLTRATAIGLGSGAARVGKLLQGWLVVDATAGVVQMRCRRTCSRLLLSNLDC